MRQVFWVSAAAALVAVLVTPAMASCGAAFCSLNSGLEAQDIGSNQGALFDLRYEHILQNQPRSGDSRLAVGEVPQHHDEVKTLNNNLVATFDYAVGDRWGVTARLPYVDREHEHIHHHNGGEIVEQWHLSGIGDAQVTARYALRQDMLGTAGVRFGVKLPTGKYHETNADGDEAERSLQPGSGTTDAIVGGYMSRALAPNRSSLFAQAALQAPLAQRDEYQPGAQITTDLGMRYALGARTTALAQINMLYKWHDRGAQAEPEDSGGRYVFFSPGISHGFADRWQVYTYAQLPVYQYVNGIQLTSKWAGIVGVTRRF